MTDPVTAQPTRDKLRALAARAADDGYTGNDDYGHLTVSPAVLTDMLDQLDQAEAERDRNLRNSREAKKRAIRAEARIKRLENRAASETARANEWRRKHRVMTEKRDAAHRAWFEEAKVRREAETRAQAVEDVLAHHPYGGPDQEDAIRRALDLRATDGEAR